MNKLDTNTITFTISAADLLEIVEEHIGDDYSERRQEMVAHALISELHNIDLHALAEFLVESTGECLHAMAEDHWVEI